MIVLDTNVLSELMRPRADRGVVAWVDQHPASEIHVTAITVAELMYGIARLPHGRRRSEIAERVRLALDEDLGGRVLAFDGLAAKDYAAIVATREERGEPISMADAQIAAICRSRGAALATRDTSGFVHTGVEVVNPWPEG